MQITEYTFTPIGQFRTVVVSRGAFSRASVRSAEVRSGEHTSYFNVQNNKRTESDRDIRRGPTLKHILDLPYKFNGIDICIFQKGFNDLWMFSF